jgi:hypothetical protein
VRDHGIDYESEREDPLDMDEARRVADAGFTLLILICVVCVLAIWMIARTGLQP